MREPSKHPLWGRVEISFDGAVFSARLHLSDGAVNVPQVNVSERVLEGNTCDEVNEAALLVISIMQREQREREASPSGAANSDASSNSDAPPSAPDPPLPTATSKPLDKRAADVPSRFVPPETPAMATTTTLGAGGAWSLWNGQSPAIGLVAELERAWGRFAVRPHLGWSTSVNPIPTTRAVKVDFTTYDAGLRLCLRMLAGLSACGGPTVQRITVVGDQVGEPIESSAWFPGVSVGIVGSHDDEGVGLWGAVGANVRFKEIALDVSPLGTLATVKRATVYAWVGPQWRWR